MDDAAPPVGSTNQQIEQYREMLATGQWFSQIPADFQWALLQHTELKTLQPQQYLFRRDDGFDGLYCVIKGSLRINSHNEQGKEALLAMIEPYNWFGEIALIDGLPRTHDAVAETACTLLRVPPLQLEQILQQQPHYWRFIARLCTQKLRFTFLTLEETALMPAFKRLVSRLILMAEGYGEFTSHSRRVLHLPQEQLANMLGISRQTTNQILKQLEARQIIHVEYREIEILNMAALKTIYASD